MTIGSPETSNLNQPMMRKNWQKEEFILTAAQKYDQYFCLKLIELNS